MKLINDAGEVVSEFDDNDCFVVYTPEGIQFVLPSLKDTDQVPDHIFTGTTIAAFGQTEEGAAIVMEWFERTLREAQEEE